MVRVYNIIKMSFVAFLIVQIVDASSSGLNSVCPSNTLYSCCRAQNTDTSYPLASGLPTSHIFGSSCDCGRFLYDIQVPPNVRPSPAKLSYPYKAEYLSSPCQQTLKHFGYQLQVPIAHRRDSNYGSFSGIIDKSYKKCTPCPI